MKKLLIALVLFFVPAVASAQCNGVFPNLTTCGNSTGASNTPRPIPFSQIISGGGGVLGPGTSTLGNIAYWNNLTGTLLGSQSAFQSINTMGVGLYSQLGTPPANVIASNNGLQISIGPALGPGQQQGQGTTELQQAVVGTWQSDPADTIANGFGINGYAKSNGGSLVNAVGTGGFGYCAATNGSCWGFNGVAANALPIVTGGGVDVNFLAGAEFDVNITQKSGSVEPTITQLAGVYMVGGGDSTVNQGTGYVLDQLSVITGAKWADGFKSRAGAAVNAFTAGPSAKTGNNVPSQNIIIQETGGTGAVRQSSISSDGGGDFIINGAVTSILAGNGVNYLVVGSGLGGSGVQLARIAAAGMIVNSATGVLSTTPTGTGVQTALGVAVGTAGSFVVNGGALGTPTSGVGTNLTGTASGLTAGHVTTNANLTGPITSSGNATAIAAQTGTGTTFAMSAGPTFTGTVQVTSALTAGTDGSRFNLGPGGTGTTSAELALNGGSGAAAGALLLFQKNSATSWFLGHVSRVEASGTSNDLEYFNQSTGARTMRLSTADDSVSFASTVNATSGTVGAINTLGGIGVSKDIWGNGQEFLPSITTSSVAQTGTVCWTTGTGKFTVDTTVGCLTSLLSAKNITEKLAPARALAIVDKLDPFAFRYKDGWGDSGHYEQFGLGAEEVAAVDERLVGRDPDGNLQGVRYQEMTAVLAGAIQQLKADNDNLRACNAAWKCRIFGWK